MRFFKGDTALKSIWILPVIVLVSACALAGQSGNTPLQETRWDLQQLVTGNIEYAGTEAPHLRFEAERVTGNDGCNNFFGPYRREKESLTFGLLASTRMACPQIEGFEILFQKMLAMTTRYRVSSDRLELYADEELLASFVAAGKE